MSELMTVGQALTMSSREIAELVDSRHDSVKRTMFTTKGVHWVAGQWAEHQLAQATQQEAA